MADSRLILKHSQSLFKKVKSASVGKVNLQNKVDFTNKHNRLLMLQLLVKDNKNTLNLLKVDNDQLKEMVSRLRIDLNRGRNALQSQVSSAESLENKKEQEFDREADLKSLATSINNKTKALSQRRNYEQKAGSLDQKYFQNVIKKHQMVQRNEERRIKMKEEALKEGKNSHEDIQELAKRRIYQSLLSFNRYLTVKLNKEFADNLVIEKNFDAVTAVAPNKEINEIVDKITSHDRVYNEKCKRVVEEKENTRQLKFEINRAEIKLAEASLTVKSQSCVEDGCDALIEEENRLVRL